MSKSCVILRACGLEAESIPKIRDIRPNYFSKYKCVSSIFKPDYGYFSNPECDVFVVWDGEENGLFDYIKSLKPSGIFKVNYRNNQGSLKSVLNLVKLLIEQYSCFFLSEDDHLYLPGSYAIFKEGIKFFDNQFVALGDHLDRYRPNNGDILSSEGVFLTRNKHWRTAESYVFSFGFSSELFLKFESALHLYNDSGAGAVRDRDFFRHVIHMGHRLVTPIPAMSTHMVNNDLSPCIAWKEYSDEVTL